MCLVELKVLVTSECILKTQASISCVPLLYCMYANRVVNLLKYEFLNSSILFKFFFFFACLSACCIFPGFDCAKNYIAGVLHLASRGTIHPPPKKVPDPQKQVTSSQCHHVNLACIWTTANLPLLSSPIPIFSSSHPTFLCSEAQSERLASSRRLHPGSVDAHPAGFFQDLRHETTQAHFLSVYVLGAWGTDATHHELWLELCDILCVIVSFFLNTWNVK